MTARSQHLLVDGPNCGLKWEQAAQGGPRLLQHVTGGEDVDILPRLREWVDRDPTVACLHLYFDGKHQRGIHANTHTELEDPNGRVCVTFTAGTARNNEADDVIQKRCSDILSDVEATVLRQTMPASQAAKKLQTVESPSFLVRQTKSMIGRGRRKKSGQFFRNLALRVNGQPVSLLTNTGRQANKTSVILFTLKKMEEMVEVEMLQGVPVVVASDDVALKTRCLNSGALTISTAEFYRWSNDFSETDVTDDASDSEKDVTDVVASDSETDVADAASE